MIEIKDNTPRPVRDMDVIPVYVNNRPRILGILHVLDLGKANVNHTHEYPFCGFIRRAVLCTCTAPNPPYHIKPVDRCVFVKFGHWFITVKYW